MGGDTAPAVPIPGLFTSGFSHTDAFTGAFTQKIPIDIPPGRNGLQPDLSLQYNSQRTDDNIVGYGWSLSIPYIQVLNKTGSQDLYGAYGVSRYYTSSIDGELATTSAATSSTEFYGGKVDGGSSNAYRFSNNVWTMYDKNGTRYTFGASTDAQVNASASSTQIYKWMLTEIKDTNNNLVRYIYTKNNSQVYPSQIVYTGNDSGDPGIFTVSFTLESRPDTTDTYAPGFDVVTTQRVSKISAAVNGAIMREYNLSYTAGNDGYRSLLSSIQENGWDANHQNQVTYPATTFGYISSTTSFVAPAQSPYRVYSSSWVVTDANGDGLNDISNFYGTGGSPVSGTIVQDNSSQLTLTPPDYWASTGQYCQNCADPHMPLERGVRYVDANADGKADIVGREYNYTTFTDNFIEMYLNGYSTSTGYAWTATSSYSGVIPAFDQDGSGSTHHVTTGFFGDVNGDGLPDYVCALKADVCNSFDPSAGSIFLGNGSAWDASRTDVFKPATMFPTALSTGDLRLVDVNADGLPDYMYNCNVSANSGQTCFKLNNGTGWDSSAASNWTLGTTTINGNYGYDRGVRFLDINGDGLVDWIHSYCAGPFSSNTIPLPEIGCANDVKLNTGSGWATSTVYTLPLHMATTTNGAWDGYFSYNEYANWAGDGQQAQDVISTVTYPQGGTATVTYAKTAQDPTVTLNPELPFSVLVASRVVTSDGLGTSVQKDYSFSGGQLYRARGVRDRKFAGFANSTEQDGTTITTRYFDQGDTINTSLGEQNDGYGQIAQPFRVDVRKASDNSLLRQSFTRWDTATTAAGNTIFVFKAREVTQDYGTAGAHRDTATDYAYSTTTGNVTQITRYGEVTGNSNGTFSDTGSDKSTESLLYAVSTTTQATGLPYDDTVVDQSSTKVRETRRTYDGLALGSVSKGNETRTENWTTGSSYASTTKTYDGTYGLVTQSRDADGNLTTYTLDASNLYVATSTNALSQATGYQYDYSTGKVKTAFDPNGRLNSTSYDGLGRALTVSEPDPSSGSLVTKTTYAYTDSNTPGATSVLKTDYLSSATSTATYTYFDGLNRKLQERKQAEGNNTYAVKDWTYNNVGLLNSESLPYFASSTSRAPGTTTSQLLTTYAYDPLQRVATIANAVGSTSNAYDRWTVTTTDANGKIKDYIKDAYGNLATVVEHISGVYATTTYTWDLNKNLTKITDALGNVRNFTYDGLGRRLTAEDLHAVGDGTFGSWSYGYDAAGNQTTLTDPKSQTINYSYDALSRKKTEDYTGQSGTEITYTYDTCNDGKGRLCLASSTASRIAYNYNPLGLQSSASSTINGTSTAFVTQYSYDRGGNQTLITYPDNAQVQYNYNSAGLLDAVLEKESGGTFGYLVKNFDYSPLGQPTLSIAGNGATTTNSYDQNALYRLAQKLTTLPNGSSPQNLSYTYDALGNITQIVDNGTAGTGKTISYTYDDLSRLLSASTAAASSSPYSYAYTYDALGNIASGPLGTYSYLGSTGSNYADPDAVTAIAGSTGGSQTTSTSTIALDTTSTNITTTSNGTTTKTWTHTVSGTNPVIVLTADIAQTVAGTGSIGSASWNGGAFTKATSTRTANMETEVWYLVATTTGAKTMSVTVNGNTDAIRLAASSFTGVSPTLTLDKVASANGSGGNPSVSVTPGMATDVVISTLSKSGGGATGGGGGATPAFVQSKKDSANGIATFTNAVTNGNAVVVGLTIWNTTVPSNDITDNKGNTYTKAVEVINPTTSDHVAIFYATNVTGARRSPSPQASAGRSASTNTPGSRPPACSTKPAPQAAPPTSPLPAQSPPRRHRSSTLVSPGVKAAVHGPRARVTRCAKARPTTLLLSATRAKTRSSHPPLPPRRASLSPPATTGQPPSPRSIRLPPGEAPPHPPMPRRASLPSSKITPLRPLAAPATK
jgi:YD repeat-containing protein